MNRTLFALTAAVVAALSFVAVSTAAAPLTLTAESLNPGTASTSDSCSPSGGTATVSFTGLATGPYTGAYTAQMHLTYTAAVGGLNPVTGTETFTITSGSTTVTGTKQISGVIDCFEGNFSSKFDATYTATIHDPTGNYHDEGTANGYMTSTDGLSQQFISNLPVTTPVAPTTKDQCQKDGWQAFGLFKNQGDCVSFVTTNAKNAPG